MISSNETLMALDFCKYKIIIATNMINEEGISCILKTINKSKQLRILNLGKRI